MVSVVPPRGARMKNPRETRQTRIHMRDSTCEVYVRRTDNQVD